jgi:hypothetical protein
MKSLTTKLMITAAALAIATSLASAQSLKADIPFAFRASGKVMAPGAYTVKTDGSRHYVILANTAAKDTVIAMPVSLGDPPKNWTAHGNPVVAFDCGAGSCELARLWTASGYPAMRFAHAKSASVEEASLTEIRLVKNGD